MRRFIKLLFGRRKEGLSLEEKRRILRAIMDDRDLYDVASGIRGPDLKCKWGIGLKEMYTMTVRAIATQSVDPIETILYRITPEKLEEVLLALKYVEGRTIHYITHIAFAFRAFADLLLIPEDVYLYVLDTIDIITEVAQMGGDITESIKDYYLKIKEKYSKLRKKYIGGDQSEGNKEESE